jgi:predicted ATP-dependent serine protease
MNLKFDTLGFSGKWLKLIGDPAKGFSTMIYGRPKMGKSYLAIEFASYLAHDHGKVLYIASEERISKTLQEKLAQTNGMHPDFHSVGMIPKDLSNYDFVFIDSVNHYGLKVDDLRKLQKKHPRISFVYIFQTTKTGLFRGSNEFQHDVDVVIEIPQKGKAVQFGRFNSGGTMNLFKK